MKLSAYCTIDFNGHSEIDLCTPTYWHVSLEALFEQLSLINRWPGNLSFPYSALQHALLVAETIQRPQEKIYGLLHTASDAVMGNISGPTKTLIDNLTGHEFAALRRKQLTALCAAFIIDEPCFSTLHNVAIANQRVYATELRDVVKERGNLVARFDPLPQTISQKRREELVVQAIDLFHVYRDMLRAHAGEVHHG